MGRHEEQHADDAQAAHPRAQDVEGIDASCLFAEVRKDEADAQPPQKNGNIISR